MSETAPQASTDPAASAATSWPRGSEWRKWDLHVHSPESANFQGDWNGFIIQLGNADCDVIGINDYFSVSGYKEVQRRLNDPSAAEGNKAYRDALDKLRHKVLLPVVECRMTNVVLGKKTETGALRINFHIVFDPDLSLDDIERFIKTLSVKGATIGQRYSDRKFLLDECQVDFHAARNALRGDQTFDGKFLIWIPYDEYGGIGDIDPENHTLFKEGLVSLADILGSSNRKQADFFLWKDSKYPESSYRKWFGRRKPCIKGSDSHSVNDEVGRLKDHNSQPIEKYCWIKADPTFGGLKQIINEPEARVHIGKLPPKLAEVIANTTRFVNTVTLRRKTGHDPDHQWFDVTLPLNADMIAIIGNKGSGKSALADVLALAGNTHCDTAHFSFLTKERFCEKNGRIAKDFEVELEWMDNSRQTRSLFAKPDANEVERIKYIPQSYLETVCTETAPGEESEFQTELRKVIFSHITDADRLGQGSLDELIAYKTEEIRDQLQVHRQEISRLNGELVRLESRATPEFLAQLSSQRALRQKELEAHVAAKPAAVEQPGALSPEEQAAVKSVADMLKTEREALAGIENQIGSQTTLQKRLTEQIAAARKLEGKLTNFEAEHERLVNDTKAEVTSLGLSMESMVTLVVNKKPLTELRDALMAQKTTTDASLYGKQAGSLPEQLAASKARIKELQDRLDAPNRRYQQFLEAMKAWDKRKHEIEGSAEQVDSLAYFDAQIVYIGTQLPADIAEVKEERRKQAKVIHAEIAAIRDVHTELFGSVQKLIEESVIIREGFKLTFESSIVDNTFQRDFFDKFINQGVVGSFYSKDKGAVRLDEIRADFDFNKPEESIAFVERIVDNLVQDYRTTGRARTVLADQLRKNESPKSLYDYLWSFTYLEPEYSLRLDNKELSHLSPGERGTLLLVFYLLVDKSNSPIIVDQPEENLDNHTVYRLLIPVIKDVKRRRQLLMVTHSPNIAVVCDAEQIIHAHIDRANGNKVHYSMGGIESPQINRHVVDVLEGTRPAFDNRGSKYLPDHQ